ncbi:MAG: hypothetical protein JSU87_13375 [Gemmatimonadota bacterium]|nr:MAG: hypothetical protein JSU87_13375 [Gemmatimonadota bacterium]
MNERIGVLGLIGTVLLAAACEEVTTRTNPTTLRVELSVGSSPFIAAGDTLVNDTVVFRAQVFDGEREVSIESLTFTSSDASVVQVIDEPPQNVTLERGEGLAAFKSTGDATVTASILDPDLEGTVDLSASLNVRVTAYTIQFGLTSTVTGSAVSPSDGLVGDTVQVTANVTKDGLPVSSTGLVITGSSNTDAVDPNGAPGPDRALLKSDGTATLTMTLAEPPVPGNPTNLLRGTLAVTVKDFVVQLDAESLVPGSTSLIDGDTLVTDSVAFRATVIRAGNDTLKNFTSAGTRWTSSDPSVVRIVGDTIGIFEGTGFAELSVVFDDLDLPGEFRDSIRVSTFVRDVNIESGYTGAATDTLVTDSVKLTVSVTKDGQPRFSSMRKVESSDSTVVSPRDTLIVRNEAVFANTGQARVWTTLDQPRLPRRALRDSIDLRVTTYVLTAESVSNPTPVMGDTVQYNISVRDTRGDTLLQTYAATFQSSDPTVVRLLNAATGRALARDIGLATVSVTLNEPTLPNATLADAFNPTNITVERFYGVPSVTSGDFRDLVIVASSEVHKFTANTRVLFPNGTIGFVESATADELRFVVGAGANTGQLTFINLVDDLGGARDVVLSRFNFTSAGTEADPFEPNDAFPLPDPAAVNLTTMLPFAEVLSIEPRTAPPDSNFFWIRVPTGQTQVFNVRAEWQQDNGNIDFFVCNGLGVPTTDPPSSYDDMACTRPKAANTSGPGDFVEEQLGLSLGPGRHVFGFYCPGAGPCPSVALTYKVTITQQ